MFRYNSISLIFVIGLLLNSINLQADMGLTPKTIIVSDINPIVPKTSFIFHGSQSNRLGYWSGAEDAMPMGAQDFAIDLKGRIIIIDNINRKVLRLEADLKQNILLPLPEQVHNAVAVDLKILMTNNLNGNNYFLTLDDEIHQITNTFNINNTKQVLNLRMKKYTNRLVTLTARFNKTKKDKFVWRIPFNKDVFAVYPLTHNPVKNHIYIRVDYLINNSPLFLNSEILIFDLNGYLKKRFKLKPPGKARFNNNCKVGLNGTVAQLVISETKTEVRVWEW